MHVLASVSLASISFDYRSSRLATVSSSTSGYLLIKSETSIGLCLAFYLTYAWPVVMLLVESGTGDD